jgi:hypothetical protein
MILFPYSLSFRVEQRWARPKEDAKKLAEPARVFSAARYSLERRAHQPPAAPFFDRAKYSYHKIVSRIFGAVSDGCLTRFGARASIRRLLIATQTDELNQTTS